MPVHANTERALRRLWNTRPNAYQVHAARGTTSAARLFMRVRGLSFMSEIGVVG